MKFKMVTHGTPRGRSPAHGLRKAPAMVLANVGPAIAAELMFSPELR
jgi:hypothetical protein